MIIGGVDDSVAQGDGHSRPGRHHELQAVHGLPRCLPQSDDASDPAEPCSRHAGNGGMIMMHAENGIAIDLLAEQAVERGETDPYLPRGMSAGPSSKAEATHRAIQLAKVGAAPLYIVHLSASGGARTGRNRSRSKGMPMSLPRRARSTCTSTSKTIWVPPDSPAPATCAARRCAPSTSIIMPTSGTGLRTNDLSRSSATDHCPFCMKEQKELGVDDFRAIPNGIGGVEHRMDLIYQGVLQGEITLPRWVELCSTTPAQYVRHVPEEGHHRARQPTPTSCSMTQQASVDDQRRQPPHEHGLLRLRGLRDPGQGRHRACPGAMSLSRTSNYSGSPRVTGSTNPGDCPPTSSNPQLL